jgi:hypothetical protein
VSVILVINEPSITHFFELISKSRRRHDNQKDAYKNNRVRLRFESAKLLEKALKVHPSVFVFPAWELPEEASA